MLAAVKSSSIIFYAVAAVFAVLLAIDFFIALLRPRRLRRGGDVLFFIVGTLLMLITLTVGLFAVINRYNIFGLSVLSVPDGKFFKLLFYSSGKEVFSLPYLGKGVDIFAELDLSGIIIPFAVFLICLISVITVGAKTYGRKHERKVLLAKLEENLVSENEPAEEETVIAEDRLSNEPEEPLGLPEIEPSADGDAKSIIDEVDKLMTFGLDFEESSELQTDGQPKVSDENEAEFKGDLPESKEYEAEESESKETESIPQDSESDKADNIIYENAGDSEKSDAIDDNVEYEYATARTEREIDYDNLVETEVETHEEESRGTVASADALVRTRVRTIVRRPAAKSITEIEKRAEEIRDTAKGKNVSRNKNETKKAALNTAAKTAGGNKSQKEKSATAIESEKKNVEAQSGGLPLTRKYIILNKHNAAAVFNNYLNSKRESEKEELTGSLNTIIIK